MQSDWLKLVIWLSTSNQSAKFQTRVPSYAALKIINDIGSRDLDSHAITILRVYLGSYQVGKGKRL